MHIAYDKNKKLFATKKLRDNWIIDERYWWVLFLMDTWVGSSSKTSIADFGNYYSATYLILTFNYFQA